MTMLPTQPWRAVSIIIDESMLSSLTPFGAPMPCGAGSSIVEIILMISIIMVGSIYSDYWGVTGVTTRVKLYIALRTRVKFVLFAMRLRYVKFVLFFKFLISFFSAITKSFFEILDATESYGSPL